MEEKATPSLLRSVDTEFEGTHVVSISGEIDFGVKKGFRRCADALR